MDINNYLNKIQPESYLQEIEIKELINIPKEKVKKSLINIKSLIDSNDINKLKTSIKNAPKVEFSQIEKYAKEKIKNFNSLYTLSKKVIVNSLDVKENDKGIKVISALLALAASASKNPKEKLKEFLKKIVSKGKNTTSKDLIKFILSAIAMATTRSLVDIYYLNNIPMFIIYLIIAHLIYRYI